MARLSRELGGLILPHDDYGSHLDKKYNTTGTELEEKDFSCAGKTADEICSSQQLTIIQLLPNIINQRSRNLWRKS
jgi:hypothetical protein